jgi:hypothetical protein
MLRGRNDLDYGAGETACDWQLLTIFDRILNWRSFD